MVGTIYEGDVGDRARRRRRRIGSQAILVEGRNRVRIHAPGGNVPAGFEPVAGTLEDAYLLLMQGDAISVGSAA